jgi:hypothetical protein
VSGRSRQHTEVLAVDSRRRHQSGEAVDQLQGGKTQRKLPARIGARVEEVLAIEFRRPSHGTVAELVISGRGALEGGVRMLAIGAAQWLRLLIGSGLEVTLS